MSSMLNSGDVVIENENLLGDGVNIAARLESLSQPNGITISKSIYDYVKSKTKHEFHDLGIQKIKNNDIDSEDLAKKLIDYKVPKREIAKIISSITKEKVNKVYDLIKNL